MVRTGRDVRPKDVEFLNLPVSATAIGYWQDGIGYWAEFTAPEKDFRATFPEFAFGEITEPVKVRAGTFGDPNNPPRASRTERVTVLNGLHYSERWSNGGGYEITYDRSRSRAYYVFNRR